MKAPPRPKLVSNKPPAGSVSDYVVARLEAAKSAELEFAQAYEDYLTWCRRRAIDHLDSELFAEAMKRICAKTRIRIKAKSGTAVFEGVRLSEAVPSAQAT